MFTGIVTGRARVLEVSPSPGGAVRFVLAADGDVGRARLGDSVALDGVCLTVAATSPDRVAFDVVPETLRKTTLGERRAGDLVNVEPALRTGDALGGHLVQGHVEGVGTVAAVERTGDEVRVSLRLPPHLHEAMIPKGSVALDGVSLTVGEVWREPSEGPDGRISVYLVPHTLDVTGLSARRPGDRVNVEPDLIGRWVQHHVERRLGGPAGGGA